MKLLLSLPVIALAFLISSNSMAQTEYVTVDLEIDINKSAEQVWAKVGEFVISLTGWVFLVN